MIHQNEPYCTKLPEKPDELGKMKRAQAPRLRVKSVAAQPDAARFWFRESPLLILNGDRLHRIRLLPEVKFGVRKIYILGSSARRRSLIAIGSDLDRRHAGYAGSPDGAAKGFRGQIPSAQADHWQVAPEARLL
jgi:hypothetical protein